MKVTPRNILLVSFHSGTFAYIHICCEMVRALAHEGLWELDGVERDGWVDGS